MSYHPKTIRKWNPRPLDAPLNRADLHFLIYANRRQWLTVVNLTLLREDAAKSSRRRLIHQGYLAETPLKERMQWTDATFKLIERAAQFGPIYLPPNIHQHRQG